MKYYSSLRWVLVLALCLFAVNGRAETRTLNVTDFGARGDARFITASTVAGSPVVTVVASQQAFSSADVGKLMLLFGAGPATTPTNHQDLIATIMRVDDGTNITLSQPAGATANEVDGTCGTQGAEAFQRCVDAATGTNTVIQIPAGNYLLLPPAQVSGSRPEIPGLVAAVLIRKGGIRFQGAGMAQTILTGCGAWKMRGKSAWRGQMFVCLGPVTNNYPLVFADLTMDGGVRAGNTAHHGYPASVRDGSGWDETHDAVMDARPGPLHEVKEFCNCRFTHWRGEMLKSVTGDCCFDGFILVTNCVFDDGNASAFNMSFSHRISSCTFSNLYMAMEFYEGYCSNACYFEDSFITRIAGSTAIAINGALTNRSPPEYNIQSNHFEYSNFAILTTPAENVSVVGNEFIGAKATAALGLGCAGYQGSAINSNIVVTDNHFVNSQYAVAILGGGQNRTANLLVLSNLASGVRWFAGGYGWSTNVCLKGNEAPWGLWNNELKGQWFYDDPSNLFPPWEVGCFSGKTNVITYAHGRRQFIRTISDNAIFALDDALPEKIPLGAVLQLSFTGKHVAPLYLSSTKCGAELRESLHDIGILTFVWTNGGWKRFAGSE